MTINLKSLRLTAAAVVGAAISTGAVAADCNPARTGPIIDVHLHVYQDGERILAGRPNPFTKAPEPARTPTEHLAATLAEMRKCGIVRAVASGRSLEVALARRGAAPDRLVAALGMAIPSPEELTAIRQAHARGELAMIGEIGLQYQNVKPDDPRMEPLWALAEELAIPVGLHIGPGGEGVAYGRAPGYRAVDSNAYLLEPVLLRHPKLKIFVMHAGWPQGDAMIGMLYSHPQLYVDIAAINWVVPRAEFHSYLKRLVDAGYGKRILFGLDHMAWQGAISEGIEAVESAEFLTRAQKNDIFYNNAVEFFGWTELRRAGQ